MFEKLDGLVPDALRPAAHKIFLQDLDLEADVGFHPFEIGQPQRIRINVEVWLDLALYPRQDRVDEAWDYDVLRRGILELVAGRRYNLQETLAAEIYRLVAARRGVTAVRVSTRKLDVYPDCASVGVELASFGAPARPVT